MKSRIARFGLSLAVAWLLAGESALAAPILEYQFNGTGTTSASTGTDTTAVEFRNAANVLTDLHSAAGLGVAGDIAGHALFGIDRAFDNTASTGMGNSGNGGVAIHAADIASVDGLRSWTTSGWFKTAGTTPIQNFARFVYNRVSNNGFHVVAGQSAGTFRIAVDDFETNTDPGGFGDTQKWVFFAVTYDGSLTSNNLKIYRGYRNDTEAGANPTAITLLSTQTYNKATVGDDTLPLSIGNQAARDRPLDGYLDNIRVHGAANATGALTIAELEGLRSGDVAVVPEPSSYLLGLLAGVGFLVVRRRLKLAA